MSGLLRCTGLLAARGKSATPGYGYEYAPGQFGIDVYCPELEIDASRMAVKIPFADGNRRDGVGDLLEVAGIETSRHRVNPIVLYDHGKAITLPVAMAQHPDGKYSVEIDPGARRASAWAYFYQGKGASYIPRDDEYDHAYFCEQLFDLMAKKFVRGGSIGYTVISARELPPDGRTGIPKGLHLLAVKMLELSAVVLPANQDTVGKHLSPSVYSRAVSDTARRILSMPKVCGRPLSPHLVKSLSPYVTDTMVSKGFENTPESDHADARRASEGQAYADIPQRQFTKLAADERGARERLQHSQHGGAVRGTADSKAIGLKRVRAIRDRWRKLKETKAEVAEAPAASSRAELTAAARQGDAAAKRRLYGQMRREGRARLRAASPDTHIVSGSSRRSAAAEEAKNRRQAGNTAATGGSTSAAGDSASANENAKVRRARGAAPAEHGADQGAPEGMHGDTPPKAKKPRKAPAQDSGRGIPKQETPKHVIGRAVEPGASDESNKAMTVRVKSMEHMPYGAQCLKRMWDDHSLTLADYEDMHTHCEHPHVRGMIADKISHKCSHMDELEKAFTEHYPDLPPLGDGASEEQEGTHEDSEGGHELDEVPVDSDVSPDDGDADLDDSEDMDDAEVQTKDGADLGAVDATSDDTRDLDAPTGEEVAEASVKSIRQRYAKAHTAPGMEAEDGEGDLCPNCAAQGEGDEEIAEDLTDGLGPDGRPQRVIGLEPHEHGHLNEARDYLRKIGADNSPFDEEERLDAWHHHKTMHGIWHKGMLGLNDAKAMPSPQGQATEAAPQAKSMHPHREACGGASRYFKSIALERAFGDPHRQQGLSLLKSLEDIKEGEEAPPEEAPEGMGEGTPEEAVMGDEGGEPDGDEYPGIEQEGDAGHQEPDGDEVPPEEMDDDMPPEEEGGDDFTDDEEDEAAVKSLLGLLSEQQDQIRRLRDGVSLLAIR